jgi:hypothetical protein
VVLLVDVKADAMPENIRVVESDPPGVWDDDVICVAKNRKISKNDAGQKPPFKDHKLEYRMRSSLSSGGFIDGIPISRRRGDDC